MNLATAFNNAAHGLGGDMATDKFEVQYKHMGCWRTKHTVYNDFHKAEELRAAMIKSRRYYDTRIFAGGRDVSSDGFGAAAFNGDMAVAAAILQQLGGIGRLQSMLGAHNVLDHGAGVSFKFKGARKWNYIKIAVTPTDTYDVTFGKVRGRPHWDMAKEKTVSFIYAAQLRPLIERETGLYLNL